MKIYVDLIFLTYYSNVPHVIYDPDSQLKVFGDQGLLHYVAPQMRRAYQDLGECAPLTDGRISVETADFLYGYSTLDVTQLAVHPGNQC
jgi:hypothetical protein